jgi:hypothetical protein
MVRTTARTIDAKNDRRCRRGTNHGQSRAEEASVQEMETLSRRAGAKTIVSKESPPVFSLLFVLKKLPKSLILHGNCPSLPNSLPVFLENVPVSGILTGRKP